MTGPTSELLEVAPAYALHAVTDAESADIDRQVTAAPPDLAAAFDEEVRAVRETLAVVSAATAAEPPAQLRGAVLAAVENSTGRHSRWRTAIVAAAAAIVVGLAAFAAGSMMRAPTPPTLAEQVLAAPDVQTVSGALTSGTATVVFSRDRNAGVLVMNDVPPPSAGTVYQMWLINASGPTSAGTMGAQAVAPSTTAVLPNLGGSTALAFTVEPGSGSPQPTGDIVAELPLS
jgi:anti-sigma-K factor RskA